jgi:uncharacterized OB-fold protein
MTVRIPAVEGWFTDDDAPTLLGSRCATCGSVSFPPRPGMCPDPSCDGEQAGGAPLSRTGRVWSYTDVHYQPPAPYVPAADPFEPYALAAVELDADRIVVLGQVVSGVTVDDLRVGQPVEVVVDVLFSDDDGDHVVWKWRPMLVAAGEAAA